MGRPRNDITNQRYGNMTVLGPSPAQTSNKYALWRLLCVCGDDTGVATSSDLKRGRTDYCPTCTDAASQTSPFITLYGNYRRGAESRNLSFQLTLIQFRALVQKPCFYCAYPPVQRLKKIGAKYGVTYNGLDRVDNTKGYSISNAVPCCKFCNFAKGRSTPDEFLKWIAHLRK